MTESLPEMGTGPTYSHEFNGAVYTLTEAHPEAGRYPWLPDDELLELAASIAENGQDEPVLLLPDGRILDGRNRELACKVAGVYPTYATVEVAAGEIRGFVRRKNVLRRHLTRELRRTLIADALRENPEESNRSIATATGASDKTVAVVREDLESTAEIPQLTKCKGADGRKRAKPKKADPAPECSYEQNPTAPVEPAHPFAELMSAVTKLAGDFTTAIRGADERSVRLRAYLSFAGLVDNGTTTDAEPTFIWLRGVRHLIDLAGEGGKAKTESQVKREWENYGLPPHPEIVRLRAEKARKGGGKR